MTDQQQLVKVAGMFEKESAAGNTYYVGVAGAMKFLLFKNREQADGAPGWTLFITQREDKTQPAAKQAEAPEAKPYPQHRSAQPRPRVDPDFDDPDTGVLRGGQLWTRLIRPAEGRGCLLPRTSGRSAALAAARPTSTISALGSMRLSRLISRCR